MSLVVISVSMSYYNSQWFVEFRIRGIVAQQIAERPGFQTVCLHCDEQASSPGVCYLFNWGFVPSTEEMNNVMDLCQGVS